MSKAEINAKETPKRFVRETRNANVTKISRYFVKIELRDEEKLTSEFIDYRVEEENIISGSIERESEYIDAVKLRTLPFRAEEHAARFYERVIGGSVGNWPTEMNNVYEWKLIGEYLDGQEITRPNEIVCQGLLNSQIPKNLKDLLD